MNLKIQNCVQINEARINIKKINVVGGVQVVSPQNPNICIVI